MSSTASGSGVAGGEASSDKVVTRAGAADQAEAPGCAKTGERVDVAERVEMPARAIALIAFTERGCKLAKALAEKLGVRVADSEALFTVHGPARFADEMGISAYDSLGSWTADAFSRADALVYVGACGIAVRAIAPHVRDKFSDPAVVSIDEAGRFVVPLLSGHVGGANELARAIAQVTGAQAVVSTATDVNGMFAVDEWAARKGLRIVERSIAKAISARLLEGGTVGFVSDVAFAWDVPEEALGPDKDLGFTVSYDEDSNPFERTLHLVPPAATVGVGCRRDTDPAVLERAVDAALGLAGVPARVVRTLASIDVKSDEPAIKELAAKRGWDLHFYSADELSAVPGDFTASDFVKRTVGVDNVCERAALAQGGTLLLGKQAADGTTVAIALGTEPLQPLSGACGAKR